MSQASKSMLLILLLTTLSTSAAAEEGPIVALFDMEDRGAGLAQQVLDNLTEYLALRLAERGFQIIPREQVRERLAEQKKESFRSCYEQSCQIEMGRELAAQKALSTRVLKIADTCQVGATLYDLKRAATEKAASAEASCDEKSLLEAIKTIAVKLTGQSEPVSTAPAPETQPATPPVEPKTSPRVEPQPGSGEPPPVAEQRASEKPVGPFVGRSYNLGLQAGVLSPSKGENWAIKLTKEGYNEDGIVNVDMGFFSDLYFDWRLSLPISIGVVATFFAAETSKVRLNDQDDKIRFISLSARAKYRWQVHRTVEIRPGAALGLGMVAAGHIKVFDQSNNNMLVDCGGFLGVSMALNTECAWYISDGFGLVFDLGIVASPYVRGKVNANGETYKFTLHFPPFIYLSLGGELGF